MIQRGEVWWVSFEGSQGGEIRKRRPAVVVSNDSSNRHLNRVQVVPLTSSVDKLYPSESYIVVRGRRQKAMADQIATVSKERLERKVGTLSSDDMQGVERALGLQLGLRSGLTPVQ